jgi:hypothetical protein
VCCPARGPRTQVFVLTHEGTRPEDAGTYLAELFSPAPVLLAYGRYAKAQPPCGREWTVRCWWEDRGAPRALLPGVAPSRCIQPSARK